MALTTLAQASQVQKWDAKFLKEYVRDCGFMPYMGKGPGSIFQTKYELTSGGKTINMGLIRRLVGAGVTGNSTLVGNEEAMNNYHMSVSVDWLRNAVAYQKPEQHWTEMDFREASNDILKTWAMDKLRDDLIAALGSVNGALYSAASAAQKNAWTAGNADRVLFGNAVSNYNATHSTALATIDATADKFNSSSISLLKRIATKADPHIRPTRVNAGQGREYFVAFTNSFGFRDLKEDPVMQQANREARPRDVNDNPIFQDGDLIYDGVIIREIPEIKSIVGVGAGGIDVAPVYFCGAQAVALAWGQQPQSRTRKEDDYAFTVGLGIEECRGIQKFVFNGIDHGMVTGFFASAPDA
ncbi:MAG: DUF4043 family protein [Ahrensia sp.]|nr:DUF4043 family protein [Ahrensia sp.]